MALVIPVLCLGGIYAGIYTPTEAAATTTVYTILIGFFIYRTLTVKKFKNHLLAAASTTSSIVILIFIFSALSKVFIIAQVSEAMLELMLAISANPVIQLLLLNLILFIMGMIMDDSSAIMISAVVLLPVAKSWVSILTILPP